VWECERLSGNSGVTKPKAYSIDFEFLCLEIKLSYSKSALDCLDACLTAFALFR
jgi:hypothetical protein